MHAEEVLFKGKILKCDRTLAPSQIIAALPGCVNAVEVWPWPERRAASDLGVDTPSGI